MKVSQCPVALPFAEQTEQPKQA